MAETVNLAEAFGFAIAGQMQFLPGGPFAGQWVAYVRGTHGFTLELMGGA